jgi:hypothetical protein
MRNYGSCGAVKWNRNLERWDEFRTKKSLIEAIMDGGQTEIGIEVLDFGSEKFRITRSEWRHGGYSRQGYTLEFDELWDDAPHLMIEDGEYVICGPDPRLSRKWWVTLVIVEGFVVSIDGKDVPGVRSLIGNLKGVG